MTSAELKAASIRTDPQEVPGMLLMPTARADEISTTLRRRVADAELELGDLARALGYSRSWVSQELLGDPERVIRSLIIKKPAVAATLAETLKWPSVSAMTRELGVLAGTGLEEQAEGRVEPARAVRVGAGRVVRKIAYAGRPSSPTEEVEVGYPIPEVFSRPDLQLFLAEGPPLLTPDGRQIHKGDILMVDPRDTVLEVNRIYLLRLPSDEALIAIYKRIGGRAVFYTDDPDRDLIPEGQAAVLGRVVAFSNFHPV